MVVRPSGPCILVYNLPTFMDVRSLNTLFDGHVVDSLWSGFKSGRCAIVELDDETYAERVVTDAKAAFDVDGPATKKKRGRGGKKKAAAPKKKKKGDAGEATLEELEGGIFDDAADADNQEQQEDVADDVAASFARVQCCGSRVMIRRSPVKISDFLNAKGGAVPGRGGGYDGAGAAVARRERKPPRQHQQEQGGGEEEGDLTLPPAVARDHAPADDEHNNGGDATVSTGVPPAKPSTTTRVRGINTTVPAFGAVGGNKNKLSFDDDSDDDGDAAPKKKQSRQEPADNHQHAAPAASSTSHHDHEQQQQPAKQPRFSGDQCKKCGSTSHLTRHCPGPLGASSKQREKDEAPKRPTAAPRHSNQQGQVGETPRGRDSGGGHHREIPEEHSNRQEKPAANKPPVVARAAGSDACKFCGSSDHLSRRCPTLRQ